MRITPQRYKALKDNWLDIYNPLVEQLLLQVRFNLKTKHVEIKVSDHSLSLPPPPHHYILIKGYGDGRSQSDGSSIPPSQPDCVRGSWIKQLFA